MYYVVLACAVLVFAFLAVLLASRFGHTLAGIPAATSSGCAPPGFPCSGASSRPSPSRALAEPRHFLVAVKDGFVNPEMLSWHESRARCC